MSRNHKILSSIKRITKSLLLIEQHIFMKKKQSILYVQERLLATEAELNDILRDLDPDSQSLYQESKKLIRFLQQIQKKYPSVKSSDMQTLRKHRKVWMEKVNFRASRGAIDVQINERYKSKLYPILDPMFNIREAVKNMILLEDHVMENRRRCLQCCKKHSLLIEAFLEEAISLDKKNRLSSFPIRQDISKMRNLEKLLLESPLNYAKIARTLKTIRNHYFEDAFAFVKKM